MASNSCLHRGDSHLGLESEADSRKHEELIPGYFKLKNKKYHSFSNESRSQELPKLRALSGKSKLKRERGRTAGGWEVSAV